MDIGVINETAGSGHRPPHWRGVLTHTHTYSGRADYGGTQRPPESYAHMAAWAQRVGAAAVAMGSPWTPETSALYQRYDEDDRATYYDPGFDKRAVLETAGVATMLTEANRAAAGRTLFFLDNETPKGRYGHLWWVGWRQDFPAWHDYDQDFDRWMLTQTKAGEHGDEPMAYARRPYLQIVAEQRLRGALGFWAHPTSWWTGDQGQFITNIAAEMPVHALAEGFIDGLVVMGYHPYRPEYLALWHDVLDRGYRAPGVAEMDSGLSDAGLWRRDSAMLNYVPAGPGALTVEAVLKAMRNGQMYASSGPHLDLQVDGQPMGSVIETSPAHRHHVVIEAQALEPDQRLCVELCGRGGQVLWTRAAFSGGRIELAIAGLPARGYLIARVFAQDQRDLPSRNVSQFAVTNPVHLHPRGQGFNPPTRTLAEVVVEASSEFLGGEMRGETAAGELLHVGRVCAGATRLDMPATGRIRMISSAGRVRTDYLVNANAPLQDALRYLYRGRFLDDRPELQSGDVPPEVWPWERMAAAMAQVRLTY